MSSGTSADTGVWAAALDALEADLAETERTLLLLQAQGGLLPEARPVWTPPAAPLPPALAPRVAALLQRHQQASGELAVAMANNRRQQRLASQLDQRTAARPVYVDAAV